MKFRKISMALCLAAALGAIQPAPAYWGQSLVADVGNFLSKPSVQEELRAYRVAAMGAFITTAASLLAVRLIMGSGNDINSMLTPANYNKLSNKNNAPSFEDYIGEVPESLKQVVDMIKNPDEYKKFKVSAPKGVLFVGPPGVGKTYLAAALARESEVPFFSVSATGLKSMWRGGSAKVIRDMFKAARKAANKNPHRMAVIFIDEFDAIGCRRGGFGGIFETSREELNTLLSEMDGLENKFDSQKQSYWSRFCSLFTRKKPKPMIRVIVIAATNCSNELDEALTRAGRFDSIVQFQLPDSDARTEMFERFLSKLPYDSDIGFAEMANLTEGMTGAAIQNIVNHAARAAAADRASEIREGHLILAIYRERERATSLNENYLNH